jgi:hypothetical protein
MRQNWRTVDGVDPLGVLLTSKGEAFTLIGEPGTPLGQEGRVQSFSPALPGRDGHRV